MWRTLIVVLWGVLLVVTIRECSASAEPRPDVALWLARSCVGEAGWNSAESGECAAIVHIYRKRAALTRVTIYRMARKYSAALKSHRGRHPHPWVLHLNRAGTKPRGWSPRLQWSVVRRRWAAILKLTDDFLVGMVADPTPAALHYGGPSDRHRLNKHVWAPLGGAASLFSNTFFRRRTKEGDPL